MKNANNIDFAELEKFGATAWQWWNPEGAMRALHHINPLRLGYIDKAVNLHGKKVLDLGCGGGILSESMAEMGAQVTGIDASAELINIARAHDLKSGAGVEYVTTTSEQYAGENASGFDVIACMELLEHVPDISSLIASCTRLLKPGGHLIIATLNRNYRSYVAAIVGAEYLLGLLPKGTHDYHKFIKPSELAFALRQNAFSVVDIAGMSYIPGLNICTLTTKPTVNYLMHAVRN